MHPDPCRSSFKHLWIFPRWTLHEAKGLCYVQVGMRCEGVFSWCTCLVLFILLGLQPKTSLTLATLAFGKHCLVPGRMSSGLVASWGDAPGFQG